MAKRIHESIIQLTNNTIQTTTMGTRKRRPAHRRSAQSPDRSPSQPMDRSSLNTTNEYSMDRLATVMTNFLKSSTQGDIHNVPARGCDHVSLI
ncbi:hypothetical protein GWI33_009182 [Rhynchophorus ferrugineus]|uniref:Uncharacterized protein n=1 Tax=Rhynchophorus ferrugineus TaxID=354439 RepID=A0A834IB35_RHYFE|nr:hypothetical protein GWI33_009182 [Rhynchophorus ferrugineus]